MTREIPPRNELIQLLLSKLTPEGREAWENLEDHVESHVADAGAGPGQDPGTIGSVARLNSLPERDQTIVERLFDLQVRATQAEIEESERRGAQLDWEMWILHRGYELLDSEGEDARWPDTLEEALAILERHGERPPPPPEA